MKSQKSDKSGVKNSRLSDNKSSMAVIYDSNGN